MRELLGKRSSLDENKESIESRGIFLFVEIFDEESLR
jgi:hypothetical protein